MPTRLDPLPPPHALRARTAVLVVSLALLAPGLAHAKAAPWETLRGSARALRVGDFDTVLSATDGLQSHKDGDVQLVARWQRAKAFVGKGQGDAAAAMFAGTERVRSLHDAAWRLLEVDVLAGRGRHGQAYERLAKLRDRHPTFRWARADLTFSRLAEKALPADKAAAVNLDLYPKSHLHLPQDELLARAARLAMSSGNPAEGKRRWRKLLMRHPESAFVDEALKAVPLDSFSDKQRLDRAELLFARRDYERCRAEARVLWDKGYARDVTGYLLGKIGSERLRDDYAGAVTYFEAAIDRSAPYGLQALSSYGIVLAKVGRHDEAVKAFDEWLERYSKVATRKRVTEAHYDRGRVLRTGGKPLQASRDLAAYLRAHKGGHDWGKYWWFVGFWAYLGGDYEAALKHYTPLLGSRNTLVGGKARYWKARTLDKLGRRDEAVTVLTRLLRDQPLAYYTALGEDLLRSWGEGKRIPKRPDLSKVPYRDLDPFAGLKVGRRGVLADLRVAVHLGEEDTARDVFDDLERKLRRKLGRKRFAKLVRDLADPLERYARPRQKARRTRWRALRSYPTRKTVHDWRAIYPRAYATHAVASSARDGAPEWMIYAHMLQESRYKPWVISNAPAYGLLELLDRTARRLADEKGDDYQLWMLMVPSYNVRWGGQYLGALYRKFHQQLPFAIASYNGGPMLLEYHVAQSKGLAFDEMIDDLGTHQSRNYVRKVIEHFLRYLAIYEKPERAAELRRQLLPASWHARYLAQPDY